ncbi:MAG: hypothetical protein AAGD96_31215 [Chloroflexota bacterium]
MSNKPRKSNVDSFEEVWRVKPIDPDFVSLRVRHPDSSIPIFTLRYRFNEPWLFYGELITGQLTADDLQMRPITPKLVAEIIKQVVANYPDARNLNLELNDGELFKMTA